MSENWIPKETTTKYLTEGDNAQFRVQAEKALAKAKEQEAARQTIPVWIDRNTTKLVSLEKIKKKKMEIIKVKIGKGELVFMEKNVAIKNGFINE